MRAIEIIMHELAESIIEGRQSRPEKGDEKGRFWLSPQAQIQTLFSCGFTSIGPVAVWGTSRPMAIFSVTVDARMIGRPVATRHGSCGCHSGAGCARRLCE